MQYARLEQTIMRDEGFSAHPYFDTHDPPIPTIGYGTTRIMGRPVTMETPAITATVAREFLRSRLFYAFITDQILFARFAELNDVRGRSGRPPLGWYDEFVQLLLEFAHIAAIDPVVRTDRISGKRTGPFIELALAFEQLLLLYEHQAGHSMSMRSPSRDACAKRLERSRSRLRGR